MSWKIDWAAATEEEKAAYEVAVLAYVPERPGYVWDHGWYKIRGYDEVSLHHVADLAQDIWCARELRQGHDVPCRQDRRGKSKGKWRKRKFRQLKFYEAAHWYMMRSTETGKHISTQDPSDEYRRWDNGYR